MFEKKREIKMQLIESDDQLISNLRKDLLAKFNSIIFITQLPLKYEGVEPQLDLRQWGMFSEYTFGLAVNTARVCKNAARNTNVAFALLVDDLANSRKIARGLRIDNAMHAFYSEAKLLESYEAHLKECNFNENNIIRSDHQKAGREHCIYFSKKVLIGPEQRLNQNRYVMVYRNLIKNLSVADHGKSCCVGFIPSQHRDALSQEMGKSPFNWLNVYMPIDVEEIEGDTSNLDRFYEAGVYYDFNFSPRLA